MARNRYVPRNGLKLVLISEENGHTITTESCKKVQQHCLIRIYLDKWDI